MKFGGVIVKVRERLIDKLTGYSLDTTADVEYVADELIKKGVGVMEWVNIDDVQDLPKSYGKYLVVIHRVNDWFGERDEVIEVDSACFDCTQKIWEITPYESINALISIFGLSDDLPTKYVTHWLELPELPKEKNNV